MGLKNIQLLKLLKEAPDNRTFQDGYDDSDEFEYEEEFGKEYDGSDEDDSDDDGDHLCYLIRSMFNNYGLSTSVERDDLDISVYVYLQRKEKMKNILKAFDVVYKMRKDILPQYQSEFEMYESKQGLPILSFDFYYSEKEEDDEDENPF